MAETELYGPVKRFLEERGFAVKGEIGGCDLVAVTPGAPPVVVICELKRAFNLELVLQGVDRADACDEVWLAATETAGQGRRRHARIRRLCRRLGFGLLAVSRGGVVAVVTSPVSPLPKRDNKRRSKLLDEHRRRQGDPSPGGGTRVPIMTAYRQQALRIAAAVSDAPQRRRHLAGTFPDAAKILQGNVYGWFARVYHGWYGLTDGGRAALLRWPQDPVVLSDQPRGNSSPISR